MADDSTDSTPFFDDAGRDLNLVAAPTLLKAKDKESSSKTPCPSLINDDIFEIDIRKALPLAYIEDCQLETIMDLEDIVSQFPKISGDDSLRPLYVAYLHSDLPTAYPWLHTNQLGTTGKERASYAVAEALLTRFPEELAAEIRQSNMKLTTCSVLRELRHARDPMRITNVTSSFIEDPKPYGPTESASKYINRLRRFLYYGMEISPDDTSHLSLLTVRKHFQETLRPHYSNILEIAKTWRSDPEDSFHTVEEYLRYLHDKIDELPPAKAATSANSNRRSSNRRHTSNSREGQNSNNESNNFNRRTSNNNNWNKSTSGKGYSSENSGPSLIHDDIFSIEIRKAASLNHVKENQVSTIINLTEKIQKFPKISDGDSLRPIYVAYMNSIFPRCYPWLHTNELSSLLKERVSLDIAKALLTRLPAEKAAELEAQYDRLTTHAVLAELKNESGPTVLNDRPSSFFKPPTPYGPTESAKAYIHRLKSFIYYGLEFHSTDSSASAIAMVRYFFETTVQPHYSSILDKMMEWRIEPDSFHTIEELLNFLYWKIKNIPPDKPATSANSNKRSSNRRYRSKSPPRGDQNSNNELNNFNRRTSNNNNKNKSTSGKGFSKQSSTKLSDPAILARS